MNDNLSSNQKKNNFLKDYIYIVAVIVGVIVFAIVTILISVTSKPNNVSDVNNNVDEVVAPVTTFYSPVLNATVYKSFSDTKLQYNATLNQWEAHKSIDLAVSGNANVYAVLDGVVKEVYSNYLEGGVIVIEHANNLITKYGSLGDDITLKVGDTVSRGQIIGTASNSARAEADANTHLHFTVIDNDKKVDPAGYLNLENK